MVLIAMRTNHCLYWEPTIAQVVIGRDVHGFKVVQECTAFVPLSTMLVEVPMSVMVPPATAAKEMGRRKFLELQPIFLARPLITGTSKATTGVLFTSALSKAVKVVVDIRNVLGLLPKRERARFRRICFLRTLVRAMRAITVRMEGFTAAV